MRPQLRTSRLILPIGLVLFLVASCAPATATETQPPVESAPLLPSATPFQPVDTVEIPATQPPVASEAPLPVATSRGPDLHATDPATVSLASGQYQFVEFFRYT